MISTQKQKSQRKGNKETKKQNKRTQERGKAKLNMDKRGKKGREDVKKLKIVVLGEGRVGKTSMTFKYVKGQFDPHEISTQNASYLEQTLTVDGTGVKLHIWDTAGQERFHALAPLYYQNADGAVVVYDITDHQSFDRCRHWIKELTNNAPEGISIVIAGNKGDLEVERQVEAQEAENYAATVDARHFVTSAKSGKNLETLFTHVTKLMLQKEGGSRGPGRKKKTGIIIPDADSGSKPKKNKKKGGCCK
mmetsp:Transcript_45610/g.52527  ORF Transcript_45610/g.52527 Transcript_45610/m.52527 type:complete len:249 (+) Transcript_45610:264-1010(+)